MIAGNLILMEVKTGKKFARTFKPSVCTSTGIFRKNRPVAVKTLRPGTMTVEKFLEEAAIMKKIRHPKLVTLYAVCTVGEPIYIITELMPYGSLLECLRSQKGQQWTPVQMIDIGSQVTAVFMSQYYSG